MKKCLKTLTSWWLFGWKTGFYKLFCNSCMQISPQAKQILILFCLLIILLSYIEKLGLFQNGGPKKWKMSENEKKLKRCHTTLKMGGLHEKSIGCELSDRCSETKILNQKWIIHFFLFFQYPTLCVGESNLNREYVDQHTKWGFVLILNHRKWVFFLAFWTRILKKDSIWTTKFLIFQIQFSRTQQNFFYNFSWKATKNCSKTTKKNPCKKSGFKELQKLKIRPKYTANATQKDHVL